MSTLKLGLHELAVKFLHLPKERKSTSIDVKYPKIYVITIYPL